MKNLAKKGGPNTYCKPGKCMVAWIALIIAVIALVGFGGQGIVINEADGVDKLTISGTGELEVSPDKVDLFVRIENKGSDARSVQTINSDSSNAVIAALGKTGVEDEDIQSTQYRLEVNREWNDKERKYEDNGYKLYHVLKVSSTDLEKTGSLIDVVVKAGANGVDNVEFGLSDEKMERSRDEAMALAAKNAKSKAKSLAKNLGVSLGKPVRISESSYNYAPVFARSMDFAVAESAAPKVLPEDVSVRVTVNVDYEIR